LAKRKIQLKGSKGDIVEVEVDGSYKSCVWHQGLKGEKNPHKRGKRNWWCDGCKSFVFGAGGDVIS